MKFFIDKNFAGQKLCNYLKKHSIPFSMINKLLRTNKISINGKIMNENTILHDGDEIEIFSNIELEQKPNLEKDLDKFYDTFKNMILFEDQNLIAINKPNQLAVQSGTKVKLCVDVLITAYSIKMAEILLKPIQKLRIVHRLDKETSGILLIAKTLDSARKLTTGFADKVIEKNYHAILQFDNKSSATRLQPYGRIENKLTKHKISNEDMVVIAHNGKEAITEYEIEKKLSPSSFLIKFSPKTGRTHQLRVHSKVLGGYILGDSKYASSPQKEKYLYLHASSLKIPKSVLGYNINIEAELPTHFKKKIL